jgi:hypothetical protein
VSSLALRLLSGSRGARLQAALPVVAVAVATMLLLLTLGAWQGFAGRAERTAWRIPNSQAAADPTAVLASHTEHVRDRPITVIDLARLDPDAPVPPGMDRSPAVGEVWVSPALSRMLGTLPPDQLADRFDAAPAGTIATGSLAHPEELVAIVGCAPDDPAMRGATGIDSWSTTPDDVAESYILLARIGAMLMVVPLLALGGSASRLVAARRNQRMSLLRLVGGSVGRVAALTAVEASALGAAGALLGGLGYVAVLPLAVRVPIAGGNWFVDDIWVGPVWFVGALVAITGLVTASALISLLPAARQPFVTARAQQPGTARAWRLFAMAAAVVVFFLVSRSQGWRAVAIPLGLVLVAFAITGPWVIKVFGLIIARTSRGATALLAGRRLAEDPRSGWRAVAGMVLAAFIAGYMAVAVPGDLDEGAADTLRLTVPAGRSGAVAGDVRSRLAEAGLGGEVTVAEAPSGASETDRAVWIGAAGGPVALDRTRTALAGVVPGAVATTETDDRRMYLIMFDDVRIGSIIVLVSAFLVAAVSAGVGGISRVLDQQGPLTLVRLAGAPVEVLAAARRREVIAPLALCGLGAAALGVGLAMLTVGGAGNLRPDHRWVQIFTALAVVGVVGVLGADLLSRPVLRRVTADLSNRE